MGIVLDHSVNCSALIGRSVELEHVCLCIEQSREANHKLILISGEAGIGKSRLLSETRTWSQTEGFRVFQGNCFQTDSASPYAPFIDMLRTVLHGQSAERQPGGQNALSADLAPFFPELAPSPDTQVEHIRLDPEQQKRRLFAALARFFFDTAREQPLVLVIEDIHWSDDGSREFLLYLARQSKEQPLVLIATYRNDEIGTPLRTWLAHLDREHLAQEVVLARLTRQDVNHMVQGILGLDSPLRPEFLESLYKLTDGNPFFIEEVLKSLLIAGHERGTIAMLRSLGDLHIPRTVQAVVQQRLVEISKEARQVVTWAAVAGRRFDFSLLKNLLACDESQLLEWIKELINAQLVIEETAEQFAFRHALIREAIYAGLLGRERKAFHLTIARVSETLYSGALSAHIDDLAYHFYEADAWQQAWDYSRQAGERALSLFTPQAAIEHFTRAVQAASRLEPGQPLAMLYQKRGNTYDLLGNFEAANLDYISAFESATSEGDYTGIWNSLLALGSLWSDRDLTRAETYLQQALALAVDLHDPILEARSITWIGQWLVNMGRPAEGVVKHRQALAILEAHHHTPRMPESLEMLGMAEGQCGNMPGAVKYYSRASSLYRDNSDAVGLVWSLAAGGAYQSLAWHETTYAVLASPEEWRRDLEEALRLSRQTGALSGQGFAEWLATLAYGAAGQYGTAFAHARQALQIALDTEHQRWLTASRYALGQLYVWLFLPDLALPELQMGLSLAHEVGAAWWIGNITYCLATAYLLKEDWLSAENVLRSVMPPDQRPSNIPERRMRWMWGRLALAQGQPEVAVRIAEELIGSVPVDGDTMDSSESQPIPWLLKLKGEALLNLESPAQALLVLEQASEAARRREEYPLLWQVLCKRAWILRQLNRRTEAQSLFTLAQDIVARLAASIDDPMLTEQFLHAAKNEFPKGSLAASVRPKAQKYHGLTRRECEVAAQIALGKSNREVAAYLVIGERTVETHVSNVLSKLGLASRRDIAAWAANNDLRIDPSDLT